MEREKVRVGLLGDICLGSDWSSLHSISSEVLKTTANCEDVKSFIGCSFCKKWSYHFPKISPRDQVVLGSDGVFSFESSRCQQGVRPAALIDVSELRTKKRILEAYNTGRIECFGMLDNELLPELNPEFSAFLLNSDTICTLSKDYIRDKEGEIVKLKFSKDGESENPTLDMDSRIQAGYRMYKEKMEEIFFEPVISTEKLNPEILLDMITKQNPDMKAIEISKVIGLVKTINEDETRSLSAVKSVIYRHGVDMSQAKEIAEAVNAYEEAQKNISSQKQQLPSNILDFLKK